VSFNDSDFAESLSQEYGRDRRYEGGRRFGGGRRFEDNNQNQ